MALPCTNCGERAVTVCLYGYYCRECDATWDAFQPDREVA